MIGGGEGAGGGGGGGGEGARGGRGAGGGGGGGGGRRLQVNMYLLYSGNTRPPMNNSIWTQASL